MPPRRRSSDSTRGCHQSKGFGVTPSLCHPPLVGTGGPLPPSYPVALKQFETKIRTTATFTVAVMVVPPGWGRQASTPYPGRHGPKHVIPTLSQDSFTPPPLSTASVLFSFFQTRRRRKKNPTEKKNRHTYAFHPVVCGSNPTEQLGIATSPKQPLPHSRAHPARTPFDGAAALKVPSFPHRVGGRQSLSPSLPFLDQAQPPPSQLLPKLVQAVTPPQSASFAWVGGQRWTSDGSIPKEQA